MSYRASIAQCEILPYNKIIIIPIVITTATVRIVITLSSS